MGMVKEFREFAVRGNVVDMAVGIIIGGAFGKIVSSLVADVMMPPLGVVIGGVDFSGLQITLKHAVGDVPAVTLKYGNFIQTIIDFTIVAFCVFLLVKFINHVRRSQAHDPEAPPAAAPTREETLLTEIRDLLRERR